MATEIEFDSHKLLDPELERFAEEGSTGTLSVIVELASEPPQVGLADPGPVEGLGRPAVALPVDEDGVRRQMDKLENELKRFVTGPVVRLDAAQAFVMNLSADQLRAVSLLAETGLIRLNRTHHT